MTEYEGLKRELRHLLGKFEMEWFGYSVARGLFVILAFGLFFLLFYRLMASLTLVNVVVKTFLFLFFWVVVVGCAAFYFLLPLARRMMGGNRRLNYLLKNFLGVVRVPKDIFISLFQLAFHFGDVGGDEVLKRAAFVQKYRFLVAGHRIDFAPFRRRFVRVGTMAAVMLVVSLIGHDFLLRTYADFSDYRKVAMPERNVRFTLLNESLDVEYGKSFQLRLKVDNETLPGDHVFILLGEGEFLMARRDSVYVYDLDVVLNDIRFSFRSSGVESGSYELRVLPSPEITDYRVTVTPPAYTGLAPEGIKNVADLRVLYGSVLRFDVQLSDVDSLFIAQGSGKPSRLDSYHGSNAEFSRQARSSGEVVLYGSNAYFARKKLMSFSVACIPDLYPSIQVSVAQDSLKNSLFYFYGVITDDYGFSDLRFNYSLNGRTNTVVPVRIVKNSRSQEFYFEFDFAEFAGVDKSKISYFFEVFDNDNISGPKSTRSDQHDYLIPDLNEIFDYNANVNAQVNSALGEAEKLAKEIVSDVKELQKQMLDNSVDNWEKQQLAKDIVEKKEQLQKLFQGVREEQMKKAALNKSFSKQDSTLLAKQKQIQDLMDQIMDDEMKGLMEEFSKLSEEFSKEKFRNLDENMRLSFDKMSEELDRNIELLKRYQVEEQHQLLSQQMQHIRESQEELMKEISDSLFDMDSLREKSDQLQDRLEDIQANYDKMREDNMGLEKPYDLKDLSEDFKVLSEQLEQQKKNISEGKDNKKTGEEVKKKAEEIEDELEKQQQDNFMQMSLPQSDIELIIQNLFHISFGQEDLIRLFSKTGTQSSYYNELGSIQEMKRMEYHIVKDSLAALAKSNLMLASLLNDKFYQTDVKFGMLPLYIQSRRVGELKMEQQYIITYLNDMALILSDALQKSDMNGQGAGSGSGKKGNSGQGDGQGKGKDSYGGMKKIQGGMKRQLESLISKMKAGEKGQPLQQGISQMIRENEIFRQSLNEFMSESGSLSPTERQLMNEIQRLIEENIRDLSNYSISDNLLRRDKQIYNKLLMSEKATKEREEYEEKRRSESAREKVFSRPDVHFKNDEQRLRMLKTDMSRKDVKLTPYFKGLYDSYYIRLGDK